MASKPRCPICNRPGQKYGKVLRCKLGHLFDNLSSEGGDYHADPSKRLEQQEELDKARRDNERMRGQGSKGFRFGGRR